jgi:FtsP/CotA-like multicopper oxidase with cupredoxin domain
VQASGGASGALIVEGGITDRAIAALPERLFVIRDQDLSHPDAAPRTTDSMPAPMVMRDAEGDILNTGTDGGTPAKDLTLNFVPVSYPDYPPAILRVAPQQRERWRILNASSLTYLDLQLLFGDRIQAVGVIGVDGVPLNFERPGQDALRWQSHAQLPPGSRIDIVVRTPAVGERASLVTRRVDTGPLGENDPTRPLARVIAELPSSRSAPVATREAPRHVPTRRWLGSAEPVRVRRLYFSEAPPEPGDASGRGEFYITPEGETPSVFDPASTTPSIVVHSGDVEDWIIENRTRELHAFHIHQIHFLLLEWNGVPVEEPYLRDIVNVAYWDGRSAQYPSVRLRMDFRDPAIVGTFVYHCHLLDHEDAGMMGLIRVLPKK